MANKLNILFPIEISNREIDFRLFLACLCANRDNRIIIGQSSAINRIIPRMQGGIYLGKNVFTGDPFPFRDFTTYVLLKKQNFKLMHLSEEGALYPGDEDEWRKGLMVEINPNYLTADDYICTWGEYQKKFYQAREPACKENIHATGHPRFDLYKSKYRDFFKEDADKIRAKYGDFILFNTNLGVGNNGNGLAHTFSKAFHYVPTDYNSRTRLIDIWTYESQIVGSFVKLINRLCEKFPAMKFIIRPHPGEDWSVYETIFKGVDNVSMVHEGNVAPWLLACKMMIHDRCTTGLEAFLMDTPVVNYKAVVDETQDIFVPSSLGTKCFTEQEVEDCVDAVLSGEDLAAQQHSSINPIVSQLLANFNQDCFESLTNLVGEVEGKIRAEKTPFAYSASAQWQEHIRESLARTYLAVNGLSKGSKNYSRRIHRIQHFYGFDQKSLDSKMRRVHKILGKEVSYKITGKNLMTVEAK